MKKLKRGSISWNYIVYFLLALLILLFAFFFIGGIREAMVNLVKKFFSYIIGV